jgi:hypothetical protein
MGTGDDAIKMLGLQAAVDCRTDHPPMTGQKNGGMPR